MTWEQALIAGQKLINAKCHEQGIAPLSGHDIAVLAAYRAGERGFNRAKELSGDHPDFESQAAQYAAKCIAQAILC